MFSLYLFLFLLVAPLNIPSGVGLGAGVLAGAASPKENDFAEFDDGEFDYGVSDPEDEGFGDEGEEEEEPVEQPAADEEEEEDDNDFDDIDRNGEEKFEPELDEDEFETQPVDKGKQEDIELSESAVKIGPVWKNYSLEVMVVLGMVLYLTNYFIGRYKNSSSARAWFNAHMDILTSNFTVVGDSGEGEEPTRGEMVKQSDETYLIWCSGRVHCSGLLVHMQFCRRHDFISIVTQLVQPKKDLISLIFKLHDDDEMDGFVIAIGSKKILQKMQKEYEDLTHFSASIRPVNKSEQFFYLSEIAEATHLVLSERNMTFLSKHASSIESIHISDQFTGLVQDSEDSETVVVRKPEKRIKLTFYATSFDQEGPYMKFALQLLDQVKNIRLSREARDKAIKNRSEVRTNLDKQQHTQRQEAAQQRKEDKVRAQKEKTMQLSETDPERARKMEEKENKRARKKLQMKMKSVKVRAS